MERNSRVRFLIAISGTGSVVSRDEHAFARRSQARDNSCLKCHLRLSRAIPGCPTLEGQDGDSCKDDIQTLHSLDMRTEDENQFDSGKNPDLIDHQSRLRGETRSALTRNLILN